MGEHEKLQALKMVQLLLSNDSAVRKIGKLWVMEEEKSQRMKFKPAVVVNSIHQQQPYQSVKALKGAVKLLLAEEEDSVLHHTNCQLPAQGQMTRAWEESSTTLWVRTVEVLPPEPVLNATLNSLPTNSNLKLWGEKAFNICLLCLGSRQTLKHKERDREGEREKERGERGGGGGERERDRDKKEVQQYRIIGKQICVCVCVCGCVHVRERESGREYVS